MSNRNLRLRKLPWFAVALFILSGESRNESALILGKFLCMMLQLSAAELLAQPVLTGSAASHLKTVVIEKTTMSAAAQQKQTAQLFTQDTIRNQTRLWQGLMLKVQK